jgi:tetratricopeptide (TPR) repeat protein
LAQKVKKTLSSTKTKRSVKKTARERISGKNMLRPKTTSTKSKTGAVRQVKIKGSKSRKSTQKEVVKMEANKKKSSSKPGVIAPVQDPTTGLLRQTKSSAAALKHLEKGIELIFKKDYKKALQELNSLCSKYREEAEIIARARSYISICERENAVQSKAEKTPEQMYALGVMEHNKAKYDEAISYYLRSLKDNPDLDYIYYSIAASQAMKGNLTESLDNLKKAIDLNNDSRIYARNDEDFSAFNDNEEFAELVGLIQDQPSESE